MSELAEFAGVFARLKWQLLRAGWRRDAVRRQFSIIGAVFALAAALGAGGVLIAFGASGRGRDAVVLAFTLLVVGWVVVPILGFGVDESLDPTRLAVLPLSRRDLVAGLTTAALVGAAPVATAIVLGASVVAAPAGPVPTAVAVVTAALALALCVLLSRVVTTALSIVLRSRRGRDLGVFLVVLVGVLGVAGQFLAAYTAQHPEVAAEVRHVMRLSPPGLVASAPFDAASGQWAVTTAELLVGVLAVLLLLAAWGAALDRALTTVDASTGTGARRRRHPARTTRWRPAVDARWAAVAGRELRYAWREPRRRAAWAQAFVIGALLAVGPAITRGGPGAASALTAGAAVAAMSGITLANAIGQDGAAWWMHVATPGGERADVAGKLVAAAAIGLGGGSVVAAAITSLVGSWSLLPAALGVTFSVFGWAAGMGLIVSVAMPLAVPDSLNAFRADAGRGCLYGLLINVVLWGSLLLSAPVILMAAAALHRAPWLAPWTGVVGGVWGMAAAMSGAFVATRMLRRRGPDVLVPLMRDHG